MSPPTCPVTGKHIRWILLLAIIAYFIYFLVDGIMEPTSHREVFICDTEDLSELRECLSLDDTTSCEGLTDPDGNAAACVQSSCGYKLFHHIDVSIAGSSDPFDPSGATATTTFLAVMSVFYSLVPYLLGFLFIVGFLAFGDLVHVTRLVVLGVIATVNEVVFKHLLKQRRPAGSCLYFGSYGMPSGHAASSIGLLTYLLLETFVFHPNLLLGLTCQKKDRGAYAFQIGYGWRSAKRAPAVDGVDEEALLESGRAATRDARGEWIHRLRALGHLLLLAPVPLSRVYLHDHLASQVGYGSLIGAVAAVLWYAGVVRTCGWRALEWRRSAWGEWLGLRLGWDEVLRRGEAQ